MARQRLVGERERGELVAEELLVDRPGEGDGIDGHQLSTQGSVRNASADSTLSARPGLPFAGLSGTEVILYRANEARCPVPGFLRLLSRGGLEHPVVGRLAEFESLVEVPR